MWIVKVTYEVIAATEGEAFDKIARYNSDLVYLKTQELRQRLGKLPEVRETKVEALLK